MSFNLEQVRKAYQDPAISKIVELTKRIAKIESENIEIETDDLTGYGDVDSSKILYNDYWNFIRRFANYQDYLLFDGVNDYVDCGNHSQLWSQPLGKFSFSCWIYPTINDATARQVVRHSGGGTPGHRVRCEMETTNGLRFRIRNAANSSDADSANTNFGLNRWNHITCTYDNSLGSANVKIYVDNIAPSITGNLTENVNLSAILTLADTTGTDFKGRMRDFRWWTTRALTQTEIDLVMRNDSLAPTPDYWLPLYAIQSGNPVDSIGGLTAFLQSGAVFPDRGETKICFEPDYDKFALDLRFETPHEKLYDYSGKQNLFKYGTKGAAYVFGEPCPTTGSEVWYRGGSKRNVGWKFSRDDKVYLQIYDEEDNLNAQEEGEEIIREDLRMVGKTVGFSWIFRLNIASLTADSSTNTLVDHYDDGSNSYRIVIGDDGNMKLIIERAGVEYKLRTSNAILNSNLGKDIELGYSYNIAASNLIKFYLNGIPVTSTTTTSEGTHSFNLVDTFLLSQSPTTGDVPDRGFCDLNNIDLARLYNEKVLTDQQFLNHYNNKFTISDIAEGEVAITDASVIAQTVVSESFTDTSFTDTSFTAPTP